MVGRISFCLFLDLGYSSTHNYCTNIGFCLNCQPDLRLRQRNYFTRWRFQMNLYDVIHLEMFGISFFFFLRKKCLLIDAELADG